MRRASPQSGHTLRAARPSIVVIRSTVPAPTQRRNSKAKCRTPSAMRKEIFNSMVSDQVQHNRQWWAIVTVGRHFEALKRVWRDSRAYSDGPRCAQPALSENPLFLCTRRCLSRANQFLPKVISRLGTFRRRAFLILVRASIRGSSSDWPPRSSSAFRPAKDFLIACSSPMTLWLSLSTRK